ncbi:hypothetical protein [Crocosphaera sp.]|uniref:hypothetical protein n=1 Tax=Crocosphaera sp. TaxID=2729996 RepID=UPI00261CAA53|nr:hypothetical protein [Crocosphaera sp.]MDJ0580747.1 hypothetical protein [Crocosphaera sp.]
MMTTNGTFQQRKLPKISQADKAVMRDLLRIGASTPTKFEVRSNRIGTNVEEELNSLYNRHLIGKKQNSNVYYPTAKTLLSSYI